MNRYEMKSKIQSISNLPTLPLVAMEVNQLLQDVNAPIEELLALLEKDQSMAIKILRLVNSSFYGFKSKIASLRHAVTLMGYTTIQNAIVSVAVIDCLKVSHAIKGFNISDFWEHSISVAVMSRQLAYRTKMMEPEEAFTAGLVHDIGKVVLVNHFPESFVSICQAAEREGIPFYAAEVTSDTYPHNLIGSNLARNWMLPAPLDSAIRNHHGRSSGSTHATLAGLVAVSDNMVNVMNHKPGHALGPETIPDAVKPQIIEVLKHSDEWFSDIREEIDEACRFFNKG